MESFLKVVLTRIGGPTHRTRKRYVALVVQTEKDYGEIKT